MKITVHRRLWWGVSQTPTRVFLHRFETAAARTEWLKMSKNHTTVLASSPVVCKINRRIAKGEKILFPVEISYLEVF